MKAEQEGAFFLSESGEKNSTGWVRKLPQTVDKLKIETSISLEMRDEEVEIYGKPNCWDIGRG